MIVHVNAGGCWRRERRLGQQGMKPERKSQRGEARGKKAVKKQGDEKEEGIKQRREPKGKVVKERGLCAGDVALAFRLGYAVTEMGLRRWRLAKQ